MGKEGFTSKVAQFLVIGGLSIFGFGLGMNIVGMFSVDDLNDFILNEGLRNSFIAFGGAFLALVGTFIEKKAKENEKSADE